MVTSDEFFGLNAGKIWTVLKDKGPMNITKICKNSGIEEYHAFGALGWLGREGKIKIDKIKNTYIYSLTE